MLCRLPTPLRHDHVSLSSAHSPTSRSRAPSSAHLLRHDDHVFCRLQELEAVTKYEVKHGGILLDPSSERGESSLYFSPKNCHTVSPAYAGVYALKAHLVMRMLEIRTGRELLLQVVVLN